MNEHYNNIVDTGNDWNKDKHCDLDGWFVDKYGCHRPVIRNISNDKTRKAGAPQYSEFEVKNYFDIVSDFYGIKLDILAKYSMNTLDDELSSPSINDYLRKNKIGNSNIEKRIREMDSLINCYKLKNEMTVYRGIPINNPNANHIKELLSLRKGDIYWDKGYMSTSYSNGVAADYGTDGGALKIIFMEIKLKPGQHCVPLFKDEGSAWLRDEFEILNKRKQKFRVLSSKTYYTSKISGVVYIKMESLL